MSPTYAAAVPGLADVLARDAALEGVPSALAAARDGVDVLLRDRGLRRTTPDLTTESLLRGAAASAQLEGSAASVEDIRAGNSDALATGAARLNAQLLALVPVVRQAPVQALARMHVLATDGPPQSAGRPREVAGLAGRLQELGALLVAPGPAPALAVTSIAHAEVATLAPFASGNGLVARALERLLMVALGVDPTSLTVPEAGHRADEPGYREALAAYAGGTPTGHRCWMLFAARAVAVGASRSPLVV